MEYKRFKPLVDKMYLWICVPTAVFVLVPTVLACFEPTALFVMIPTLLLVSYFIITPLFGYIELREETLFVKFGFIMKREIPYSKIRGTEKKRGFYSESMLSLKCSFEHVNVKYNRFDIISVSVKENDVLISEIEQKCKLK